MKSISWQSLANWKFAKTVFTIAVVLFWTACSDSSQNVSPSSSARAKAVMATPSLTCAGSTQTSIYLQVTAGSTGAPAGFSIQWMTKAAYDANGGWPSFDSLFCKGSFSGNANLSRYNLKAGESVTVNIGEILMDNGASTNCGGPLVCGTEYVFRAFAHANSSLNRSEFTANQICKTEDCDNGGHCTYTQGYWKTHGPVGCVTGNNSDMWPVTSLTIGGVQYTDLQLCAIFQTKTSVDTKYYSLMHQLIAAKLNRANGSPNSIDGVISAAENWVANGGTFSGTWVTDLDDYNNGRGSWNTNHCD